METIGSERVSFDQVPEIRPTKRVRANAMAIPRRRKGPDMSNSDRGRHHLNIQTRRRIEALIETLIEILDEADGDTDREEDDHSADFNDDREMDHAY